MELAQRLKLAISGQVTVSGLSGDFRSRWLSGLCYFVLAVVGIAMIFQSNHSRVLDSEGVIRVDAAQVVSEQRARKVSLPNRWLNDNDPSLHRQYSVEFSWSKDQVDNFALYIPSVSKNFQITLNGVKLPNFGTIGANPSWNYNRPHLLSLPQLALLEGENQLLLDVYAHSVHDGGLSVFYLGDSLVLSAAWQGEWNIAQGAALVLLFLAVIFVLIIGPYAVVTGASYRLEALACIFAVLQCYRILVVNPWLNPLQHLALSELFVTTFNVCAMLFLLRFYSVSPVQAFVQQIMMLCIWFSELLLLLFADDIDTVYEVTHWTKLLITTTGAGIFIMACYRFLGQLNLLRLVLLCTLALLTAGGIHDSMVRFAIFDIGVDYRYQLSILYLLGGAFAYFLFDALRQSEELDDYRGELERQVEDFGENLQSSRMNLIETQQWSVLGYSSMQLWAKLKSPLQTMFESSSYIHSTSAKHDSENALSKLSFRSMYSAQRCLRTIDELELLLSEPRVELIELDMQRWLPELLRELHKIFRVDLRLGFIDHCTVACDPYLLRHCIERLVDNSDRACAGREQRGLVEVSVWASKDTAVLSVSDNGPGLVPAIAARIAQPLYHGKPNGLGVGLCIVKHYAEIMGIEVRSNPMATGACIELIFPRID